MGKVWTITVPDEVDEKIREYIDRKFAGRRRGVLGAIVVSALQKWIEEEEKLQSVRRD